MPSWHCRFPVDRLPELVRAIAACIPLTHGLAAARSLADGDSLVNVLDQLGLELAVAAVFFVIGLSMLRYFERDARPRGLPRSTLAKCARWHPESPRSAFDEAVPVSPGHRTPVSSEWGRCSGRGGG